MPSLRLGMFAPYALLAAQAAGMLRSLSEGDFADRIFEAQAKMLPVQHILEAEPEARPHYMTQDQDHFDGSNLNTWQQVCLLKLLKF